MAEAEKVAATAEVGRVAAMVAEGLEAAMAEAEKVAATAEGARVAAMVAEGLEAAMGEAVREVPMVGVPMGAVATAVVLVADWVVGWVAAVTAESTAAVVMVEATAAA